MIQIIFTLKIILTLLILLVNLTIFLENWFLNSLWILFSECFNFIQVVERLLDKSLLLRINKCCLIFLNLILINLNGFHFVIDFMIHRTYLNLISIVTVIELLIMDGTIVIFLLVIVYRPVKIGMILIKRSVLTNGRLIILSDVIFWVIVIDTRV